MNASNQQLGKHFFKDSHRVQTVGFNPRDYLTPGLTLEDIMQIKEVFDSFDMNGDGLIAPMELRGALQNQGYPARKETIYNIIGEYDEEEIGELNFQAFLKIATSKGNKDTKAEIKKVFRKYDKGGKGYFVIDELKQVAKELGETIDDETLVEIMSRLDAKLTGKIGFDEFYTAMTSRAFD